MLGPKKAQKEGPHTDLLVRRHDILFYLLFLIKLLHFENVEHLDIGAFNGPLLITIVLVEKNCVDRSFVQALGDSRKTSFVWR